MTTNGSNSIGSLTYELLGVNTTTTFNPAAWYFQPRRLERRKRLPALPVAIGHAVFFLALAFAGWLR